MIPLSLSTLLKKKPPFPAGKRLPAPSFGPFGERQAAKASAASTMSATLARSFLAMRSSSGLRRRGGERREKADPWGWHGEAWDVTNDE